MPSQQGQQRRHGSRATMPLLQGQQRHSYEVNDVSLMLARTPAHQQQQQCNCHEGHNCNGNNGKDTNGNDTITMRATTPA
jgi:hypothetical protein